MASSTQYPTKAFWNGPRWIDDSVISPTKRSPTKTPKPYPLPICRSRSRAEHRAEKLARSSGVSGAPAGRGSHGTSHRRQRARTSYHPS